MLSFMRAQYTLFQQGFNILDEIDPYMKKLAAQVTQNKHTTIHMPVMHAWTKKYVSPMLMYYFCYFAPLYKQHFTVTYNSLLT